MNRPSPIPYCLLFVLLAGCAETHTLSDGSKIRADHFAGFFTPSVTTVSVKPANSTNWSGPTVLAGQSAFSAAAGAVQVFIPTDDIGDHNSSKVTTINGVLPPPAPVRPPGRPPGHQPKDSGNRGR